MCFLFKNVWERPIAKNYHPVSPLFVVSKVFGKLVKIGFLITSRTVAFCLISSMVSTSGLTADLLTIVSDRIRS